MLEDFFLGEGNIRARDVNFEIIYLHIYIASIHLRIYFRCGVRTFCTINKRHKLRAEKSAFYRRSFQVRQSLLRENLLKKNKYIYIIRFKYNNTEQTTRSQNVNGTSHAILQLSRCHVVSVRYSESIK